MKVLVLGHLGMLGNCAEKYFKREGYEVLTTGNYWDTSEFKNEILRFDGDFVVNCIAALPGRGYSDEESIKINYELPVWIDQNTSCRMIVPGTDGEFNGSIGENEYYTFENAADATDVYGKTKAKLTSYASSSKKMKVIRTSILGIEKKVPPRSLLSWFLSLKENSTVNGYTDVLWNGVTTLEWVKMSDVVMNTGNTSPEYKVLQKNNLIQMASEKMSKYALLCVIGEIFRSKVRIQPLATGSPVNLCLKPYYQTKPIREQLRELKNFYGI